MKDDIFSFNQMKFEMPVEIQVEMSSRISNENLEFGKRSGPGQHSGCQWETGTWMKVPSEKI